MSRSELLELAKTQTATDLETGGRAWGIGRTKVFELAKAGELPFPVNRLGTVYRVPVEPLLRSLGITPDDVDAPPFPAAQLKAVGASSPGRLSR